MPYQGFFFPLDGVRDWNRLYGPRGLYQHQSVVPEPTARAAIAEMLDFARSAGQGSFLTVLKRFGPMRSPGIVSFPRAGYTLTLDFPNKGKATLDMLAGLDRITIEAGGAVNPYKDARMSAQTFAASFPGLAHAGGGARSGLHVRFLGAHGAATALCQPAPATGSGIDKIRSILG